VNVDRKGDNGEQSGTRHEGIVHSDQSTDEAGTTAVILKLVACLLLERLLVLFTYVIRVTSSSFMNRVLNTCAGNL